MSACLLRKLNTTTVLVPEVVHIKKKEKRVWKSSAQNVTKKRKFLKQLKNHEIRKSIAHK